MASSSTCCNNEEALEVTVKGNITMLEVKYPNIDIDHDPASGELIQSDLKKSMTCKLEDLPVLEQLEKPQTPGKRQLTACKKQQTPRKKRMVWHVPITNASSAALKSLTTLDIELAGSSRRFVSCSSAESSPIKSEPITPKQKSKESPRKSSSVTTDPLSMSSEEPTVPKKTCRQKLIPVTSCPTAGPSTTTPNLQSIAQGPPLTEKVIKAQLAYLDSDDDEDSGEEELGDHRVYCSVRRLVDLDNDDEDRPVARINEEWRPARSNSEEPGAEDPTDQLHFDWRGFGENRIDPNVRRLPFSERDCGPTVQPATPYEAFTQIWTRSIVDKIATETNNYAQILTECRIRRFGGYKELRPNSRITTWKDTTVDEIYRLFAILLAMGMVVKLRLADYWDSDAQSIIRTPGFAEVMSINRFSLLNRCLHFNSVDPDQPTPKSEVFKLEPLITHLNERFQCLYRPHRNLALDESLTLCKGALSIRQFIKVYEVCESLTGYLYRFEINCGEHSGSGSTPISGTVPTFVLRLLDGLEHRGHTVWMDKFYNSPELARELRNRGFDCAGTLRLNRQLVPLDLKNLSITDLVPGEVRGCTSGDVDLVVWRDVRMVAFISTYHGLATTVDKGVLKPSVVPDYNVCMGGVDTKDQMLSMFPVERTRQRVWYKKMFRRLLNVSLLNAYIIFKAQHNISHRQFRETLIKELLFCHRRVPAPPSCLVPAPLPTPPQPYPPRPTPTPSLPPQPNPPCPTTSLPPQPTPTRPTTSLPPQPTTSLPPQPTPTRPTTSLPQQPTPPCPTTSLSPQPTTSLPPQPTPPCPTTSLSPQPTTSLPPQPTPPRPAPTTSSSSTAPPTLPVCVPGCFEMGSQGTGRNRLRRTCVICKSVKRTYSFCQKCNVSVCIIPCFKDHTLNVLRETLTANSSHPG